MLKKLLTLISVVLFLNFGAANSNALDMLSHFNSDLAYFDECPTFAIVNLSQDYKFTGNEEVLCMFTWPFETVYELNLYFTEMNAFFKGIEWRSTSDWSWVFDGRNPQPAYHQFYTSPSVNSVIMYTVYPAEGVITVMGMTAP